MGIGFLHCPECGKEAITGSRFCQFCEGNFYEYQKQLSGEFLKCPSCGKIQLLKTMFCINCGQPFVEYLTEENIFVNLQGHDKKEVLYEMISNLIKIKISFTWNSLSEKILEKVLQREMLGTTGIGNGVAMPYAAKLDCISRTIIALGTSYSGIEWDSIDGKPVQLIFLVCHSKNDDIRHTDYFRRIARLLRHNKIRERLIFASTSEETIRIINEPKSDI